MRQSPKPNFLLPTRLKSTIKCRQPINVAGMNNENTSLIPEVTPRSFVWLFLFELHRWMSASHFSTCIIPADSQLVTSILPPPPLQVPRHHPPGRWSP